MRERLNSEFTRVYQLMPLIIGKCDAILEIVPTAGRRDGQAFIASLDDLLTKLSSEIVDSAAREEAARQLSAIDSWRDPKFPPDQRARVEQCLLELTSSKTI